ncbi:hypothetical protein ALC57_03510 [Trachymyrmex cornetzi]|uniref:Uncharacterized protein n=1 Tax=Trachymyrmex cornetzi TaxID=471704 RepID=A0A195EH08_9HYME|nr:hypothetical protein ALC57_03510 [Trachymyrmex cornetzi]
MDGPVPNSPLAGHGDNRMRARPRPVARFRTLVESSIEKEAEASRSAGFSQTIKTRKNRSANRIDREKSDRTRDSAVLGSSVSSRNDYRQLTITSLLSTPAGNKFPLLPRKRCTRWPRERGAAAKGEFKDSARKSVKTATDEAERG